MPEKNLNLGIKDYESCRDDLKFENIDSFVTFYSKKILSKLDFLVDGQVDTLIDLLYKNPVLTKNDLTGQIDDVTDAIAEKIINSLKTKGTTDLNLLTKPKALLADSENNIAKFYYNFDTIRIYDDLDLFFKNSHPYYRKYSLEKIEEFINSDNNNGYENTNELIKKIAGLIEFPMDYVYLMLNFLNSRKIIKIADNKKIEFTNIGENYYGIYTELSDQNGFLEIGPKLQMVIMDLLHEDSEISAIRLKNKLKKEYGVNVNLVHIKLLKDAFEKNEGQELDTLYSMNLAVLESEKKYNISNNSYVFTIIRKNPDGEKTKQDFSIPVETIDEIFYLYSERGQNLTQNEVIEFTKIKPELWNIIKSRLNLIKKSDVFGPHTLELFGENENFRQAKIKDIKERFIRDKTRNDIKKEIEGEEKKQVKKVLKTFSTHENFKEYLSDVIQNYKPKKLISKFEQIDDKNNLEYTVSFSDIHFGKIGNDGVVKRLKQVGDYVVSRPEHNINIICLGDLAEAMVEGGMHTGQKEKMDWANKDTYEQMMEITNILESFLIGLYRSGKKINFNGIGGNHDRIGKDHNQDMSRTGALIIYELIKRGLMQFDEIDVNYSVEKWNVFDMQGFRYITHHGDDGATQKLQNHPEKIANEKGFSKYKIIEDVDGFEKKVKSDIHNIILMGDKHHLYLKNSASNITTAIVPALAGAGEYDTRLGLSSNPGFIGIKKDENNLPEIVTKQLVSEDIKPKGWKNYSSEFTY